MLRRSLAGIVTPEQFAAAGIEPTARPEELDVAAWCALAEAVGAMSDAATRPRQADVVAARRGRAADGYHLIDAEMVTLDLADTLRIEAAAEIDAHRVGAVRRRRADRRLEPRRRAPSRRPAARRTSTSTSRSPAAAGSAAARPTPRRSCGGRASTTRTSPSASAPTCRSASSGGEPG